MYQIDRLLDIYEHASFDSSDYRITEYILTNIRNIKDISLSEIARNLNLAKSTVSKYIEKYTAEKHYPLFVMSLAYDVERIIVSRKVFHKELVSLLNGKTELINRRHYIKIAKMLQKADRVFIFSDVFHKSLLTYLLVELLRDGKRADYRNINCYFYPEIQRVMNSSRENVCLLVLPQISYYEASLSNREKIGKSEYHICYIGKDVMDSADENISVHDFKKIDIEVSYSILAIIKAYIEFQEKV